MSNQSKPIRIVRPGEKQAGRDHDDAGPLPARVDAYLPELDGEVVSAMVVKVSPRTAPKIFGKAAREKLAEKLAQG